ncbi:MAG: tetratricopeptide repeat protein [Snowella sp.]|nr:tetratricopeptide repeat protein [Snowella sp.]
MNFKRIAVLGKLFQLGRTEEAIAAYGQALPIKPDDDETWNNRG